MLRDKVIVDGKMVSLTATDHMPFSAQWRKCVFMDRHEKSLSFDDALKVAREIAGGDGKIGPTQGGGE